LIANVIEELTHEAEHECETSAENIRGLNEIKTQHEQLFKEFRVKGIDIFFRFCIFEYLGTS
jgi:hypothetical protein